MVGLSSRAIHVGVAVGAAIALVDLLSGQRFYWAVIGAFVIFQGTSNTEEQIGKLWSGNLLRVWSEVEQVAKKIQSGAIR